MDGGPGTEALTLREEFVAALRAGDANLAELIALDAVAEGHAVADVYVDVVAPALVDVGHQWETGRMTIADEHLATGIAWDVMRLLSRAATRYPRRTRERVLLAAIGGESHVTGLRMIGDLAEGNGFDVRFLGAAVPVDTLGPIVVKHEPEFIGLSVTMAGTAGRLTDALDGIVAAASSTRGVLVGGRGVTPQLQKDPRVHWAPDAREALRILEGLADPV